EPTNARHFSPEEPLEKKPAWPIVVAALIIFIVVTGGLTFFIRFTMSQNAAELAAIKAEGDRHLNEAITLIQEADTIVIAFDNTNENKVTEEALPQLEALLDQIPSAQETLDVAITKAELAQTTYVTAEDKQLAQYAIDAATARKDMLDLSSQLTSYDIAAMLCAVEFSTAWDLLIAADGDMRLAVEVVNENGNGAVGQAMEYNQAADDKLTQAQEAIARASELLPEADFSSIVNYLTAKRESVALAIASDEALLADDIAGANRLNDEFVSKDAQVVELATLIPEEPISLIVNAYDEATSEVRTAYHTARDLAADADAFLRAFVGTNVRAQ
ncbi:MAG: hypothetical protein LBI64_07005, partial [Coriobacteriales bacterium]|nr:hypothetical protein [Coriobacteriales bacterium]